MKPLKFREVEGIFDLYPMYLCSPCTVPTHDA